MGCLPHGQRSPFIRRSIEEPIDFGERLISLKQITVLLADDNQMMRDEFRRILELESDLEVVGEAKDGHEAVTFAKRLSPELVLMDIAMPLLNGLRATRQLLEAVPFTKVLIVSTYSDDAYLEEAAVSGAMGYLIKQLAGDTVCLAIREVHKGNTYFSSSIPSRFHWRGRDCVKA